jgi:hypothetical protein
MHDDGSMAPFCGEHRCHHGACDKERTGGLFCEEHRCKSVTGCVAGLANEAGTLCAEHECVRENCRNARYALLGVVSTFCSVHKCADRYCAREGGENQWCERHQPCSTPGCLRQRVMDGERVAPFCEQREYRTGPWIEKS